MGLKMMDVNVSQLTMFAQFLKERAIKSDNCSDFKKGYKEAIDDLVGLAKCKVEEQIADAETREKFNAHLQDLLFRDKEV